MAGKFGKFGLKSSLCVLRFSLSVSQKRQLTMKNNMKARMKISVDVAVMINQCSLRKSTCKAQVFKTVKFLIDYIQRS